MAPVRTKRNVIQRQSGKVYGGRYIYLPDTMGRFRGYLRLSLAYEIHEGGLYKDGPWGGPAELQIDKVSLRKGMLIGGIRKPYVKRKREFKMND